MPLAKHWLPEHAQNDPLDGSRQLFRQLEKLAPIFVAYEFHIQVYEVNSCRAGGRRKSKNNRTPRAIELAKALVSATFLALRAVANADAAVCAAKQAMLKSKSGASVSAPVTTADAATNSPFP